MHHSSGSLVYYGAETLSGASPSERPDLLECIVDGFLRKDPKAGNTAYWLGRDMVGIPKSSEHGDISFDTDTSHGKFSAAMSLDLVKDIDRLHGFISAIRRWPEQEAVMDVGCGAFPILALAAAIYHPGAEVRAIEISPESAESAEQFIGQFGFSQRVEVINADIANHAIDPNTTAAVTETFNAALQEEPGPQIVRLLHEGGVPIITPSRAELCLRIAKQEFFQEIDLRRDTDASIAFSLRSDDHELGQYWHSPADIGAVYYDDFGLVLPYDADRISQGLPIIQKSALNEALAKAGDSGTLTYELGCHPFESSLKILEAAPTEASIA